jgi:phosphate transport system substrate-binding protein
MPMQGDRAENLSCRRSRAGTSAIKSTLVAITAVAYWLLATPAAAQPTGAAPNSEPGGGGSAMLPAIDLSERKQLLITGSTSLEAVTDAVIEKLVRDYVMPQPIKRLAGTEQGIVDFCAGVGANFPDIVAASQRMSRSEFDACVENNVLDVIEVAIGQGAVVVAAKKGDPSFNVTPRMFYYGIAQNIPTNGEFAANGYKSWKETNKNAPDLPIHVVVPAQGSGTRAFFDDNFMQGGCRHVKEIDAIFATADRVPRCIQLRDDGLVTELTEPFEEKALDALLGGTPGTVAILPWSVYLSARDKLDVLPVSGVVPTHESIADYTYGMATTLQYYFKRANMRNTAGRGVVRGIREFMAEITKDEAAGEGGYFETLGVIALTPNDRSVQKNIARRLKRFEP